MRLGIDFGTTRTVVAQVDRGNYPVVRFLDPDGDVTDHVPSVIALGQNGLLHGHAAVHAEVLGAPTLRSIKRELADPAVGIDTVITVDEDEYPLIDLLTGFLSALAYAIRTSSSAADLLGPGEPLEAVIAVPAHAHGAQRYLTIEAFIRAGFEVVGLVNEPSAAGFEYTHAHANTITSRRTQVIVYDLGGGTFDASLVTVDGTDHDVVDSLGHNRLGGDDFDVVLADLALAAAGRTREDLGRWHWRVLLDEARRAKESLVPQTKRVVLDVAGEVVTIPVDDFYDAASHLVEASVEVMRPLVGALEDEDDPDLTSIAGIYLVGGASGLPLVPRILRTDFGRRVRRSPHPAASTAIGLAIAADEDAGYRLRDQLSRGFGVYRELDGGTARSFDPILTRAQAVSRTEELSVVRTYRAAHNIGWFRFVEHSRLGEDGLPAGAVSPFAEVTFPFAPDLQERMRTGDLDDAGLAQLAVERNADFDPATAPLVEERYVVDRAGIVSVTITDLGTGWSVTRALGG